MGKYTDKLASQVKVGKEVFIAPNATVLGDITIGDYCSIWYGAILRADSEKITIGDRTNVQDGVIFHTDPGMNIEVGQENIIGHGAVVHGCTIGNNNLIGIRAVILNKAKIGNCCIIGANALVTEGMEVPDYSMVLGSPGRIVKILPPEIIDRMKLGAAFYMHEAMQYLEE